MNELIQQARELCEKATPGPWNVENGKDIFTELGADNGNGAHAAQNDAWQVADCDPASGTEWCIDLDADGAINWGALKSQSNAAFIAASRTLVPQLCDALEAANTNLDSVSTLLSEITDALEAEKKDNEQLKRKSSADVGQIMRLRDENTKMTARAEKAEANVNHLINQAEEYKQKFNTALVRAEKAEAERDTYKAALQNWHEPQKGE